MLNLQEAINLINKNKPDDSIKIRSCIDYKNDFIFGVGTDDEDDMGATIAVDKTTGELYNFNISQLITEKLILENDEEFEKAYNNAIEF